METQKSSGHILKATTEIYKYIIFLSTISFHYKGNKATLETQKKLKRKTSSQFLGSLDDFLKLLSKCE